MPDEKEKSKEANQNEMSENEKRIRGITKFYYSNPKLQELLIKFASGREVVPRYFEGFGKRPDAIIYPSDVMGLVNKGATSFHASEELWNDPLAINSEMSQEELSECRKSWDLLIDIDSQYLDYSKIAAKLVIDELENSGIKNYGLKYSGSKGFHIIVSGNAFPDEYEGMQTRKMFPEWARAICEYIMARIKRDYSRIVGQKIDFQGLKLRTNLEKEDIVSVLCPECGKPSKKRKITKFLCPDCSAKIERANPKILKKGIRCINCTAIMEAVDEEEVHYCESCGISSIDKITEKDNTKNVIYSEFAREKIGNFREDFEENISEKILGGLDLVLVAPRHLFRMPYSLHEKTSLASVVIDKSEIENFIPGDANPLKIKIRDFMPKNEKNEALHLLKSALLWKKARDEEIEIQEREKYSKFTNANVESSGKKGEFKNFEIKPEDAKEELFPKPIKKLLAGLKDGKKRGLFILLTFLKSIGFSPDYINNKARDWNKKNEPPLKESYLKAQIDWHLKQKRKILPPNYNNPAFYKDLGLISQLEPEFKNPLSELARNIRSRKS